MLGIYLSLLISVSLCSYSYAQTTTTSYSNALEQIQNLPYFLHTDTQGFELNLDDYFIGNNLTYQLSTDVPDNLKVSIGSKLQPLWSASIGTSATVNKAYIPNRSIYGWKRASQWIALVNSSVLMVGTGFGSTEAFNITNTVEVCNSTQFECHDFILINEGKQILVDCSDLLYSKSGYILQNKFVLVNRANLAIISQNVIPVTEQIKRPFIRRLVLQKNIFYRYVVGGDYFESFVISNEDIPQISFKKKYDSAFLQMKSPLNVLGIELLKGDFLLFDQKGSVVRIFNGSVLPDIRVPIKRISTYSFGTELQVYDVFNEYSNDYKTSKTIITVGGGNKIHQIDWTVLRSPVYLTSLYIGLPFREEEMVLLRSVINCKKYILAITSSSTAPEATLLLVYRKSRGRRLDFFYSMNLTSGNNGNGYFEFDRQSLQTAVLSGHQIVVYRLTDSVLSVSKGDLLKEYHFNITVASSWGENGTQLEISCFGAKTSQHGVAIWKRGELPSLTLGQLEHRTLGIGSFIDGPLLDYDPRKVGVGWTVHTISQIRTEGYPSLTPETVFVALRKTFEGQFNLFMQQKNREYDLYSCVFRRKSSFSPILLPTCKHGYKKALDTDLREIFIGSEFNFLQGKTSSYLCWKDGKYELGERISKYNNFIYAENKFIQAVFALGNSTSLLHIIDFSFNTANKSLALTDYTIILSKILDPVNLKGPIVDMKYLDTLPHIVFAVTNDTIYAIDISDYRTNSSSYLNRIPLPALAQGKKFSTVADVSHGLLVVAFEQNDFSQGFNPEENMLYTYSINDLLDERDDVSTKTIPLGNRVPDFSLTKNLFYSDVTGSTYLVAKDIKTNSRSIIQLNLEKVLSSALQSQQNLPTGIQIFHLDILPYDFETDLIHIWSNLGL